MSLTVQDTKQDRQLTDMDLLEFERGVGFEAPDFIIAAAQKDNADDIRLTDSQLVIHDALVDFALHLGDRWYIAMAGYAGTGKTTVISKAAQRILDEDPEKRILFCAPTGKAAQVMKSKLAFLRTAARWGPSTPRSTPSTPQRRTAPVKSWSSKRSHKRYSPTT